MLDRVKLAQECKRMAGSLFIDNSSEIIQAQHAWQQIADDASIAKRIAAIDAPFCLPSWLGAIGQKVTVNNKIEQYCIVSVDGSQIYPDRHRGPSCFLINIGSIMFHYGAQSQVRLFSQPHIFSAHNQENEHMSTDMVNCRRQELEFNEGLKQGILLKSHASNDPFLLLFDGSLVFWLLESKDSALQSLFLPLYIQALERMYQEKIPIAGYISLPKSRELVNVLRLTLADFSPKKALDHDLHLIFDNTVAGFFLQPGERTTVFKNNASISQEYPDHLRPYFFYINVGTEISRVEIPSWIAQDERLTNQIAHIIIDQCLKGYGYPIAIAESHEAAVVKGADRDFFYHLLDKISIDRTHQTTSSQKSIRKRYIGF